MPTATSPRQIRFPRGTTLLEGVIAIGVILVGVVGSLVLINSTIKLGRANQDRIVAQDLAREGIELAYAQRNSGSLGKVLFPGDTWDKYFSAPTMKSDLVGFATTYGEYYDIGELVDDDDINSCRIIDSSCDPVTQSDYCTKAVPDDDIIDNPDAVSCDIAALVIGLYRGYANPPPRCDPSNIAQRLPGWNDASKTACSYNGDAYFNLLDVSRLISDLFRELYPLQTAFPTINTLGNPPVMSWKFFNPSNFTSAQGSFVLQDAWDYKPLTASYETSRIFEKGGSFIQNQTGVNGPPTKFYRVLTFQPICRGTNNAGEQNIVIPQNVIFSCYNYLKTQSGWTPEQAQAATTVGLLVTSEVRWPTPAANATHVVYQEYLYDWLNP